MSRDTELVAARLALVGACARGSLEGVRALVQAHALRRGDVRCNSRGEGFFGPGYAQPEGGTFGDSKGYPPNVPLTRACSSGNLELAQYLVATFNLGINDVRYDLVGPFRWACLGGHLEVAQWLDEAFRLAPRDLQRGRDVAAECGAEEILRWLREAHPGLCGGCLTLPKCGLCSPFAPSPP